MKAVIEIILNIKKSWEKLEKKLRKKNQEKQDIFEVYTEGEDMFISLVMCKTEGKKSEEGDVRV